MPPPRPPRDHGPRHAPLPSSAVSALIRPGRLDALLAPWMPDAEERAFVVRCIVGEGPIHHRGASYTLLCLLGLLLEELGPDEGGAPRGESLPVPIRLPPHLARGSDHDYPLALPLAPLTRLAPKGSPELAALVDCLTDGPPHHALANAAMVCLLDALFARAGRARAGVEPA
ncbi:hypothetical protein SOCE836_064620 [Sorangium cellulosum]|uniref:Uncharacterized protein n=1 Tax=Sorangium cellulosum TaxID=56 RepID=A0A4P2QVZ0_SORCE|nr:hypothetical protein SOCE836_064620 [Sorangium cellulosum]WCQ93609.1 hypothetical protein NQZ70_06361 [Sorangium sp. Soce836]